MRFFIAVVLALGLAIITACTSKPDLPFKEQIEQDFDYVFDIIQQEYPYLEAQKQLTGYDFVADYQKHKDHVLQANNKTEFFFLMNDVLGKLGNDHTHMMTKADVQYGRAIYSQSDKDDFRWQIYEALTRDELLKENYRTEIGMTAEDEENARKARIAEHNQKLREQAGKGVSTPYFDLIAKQVAYVKIADMTHMSQLMDSEKQAITDYLHRIKNYPVLILDIRDNKGGDTRYWTKFLLPQVIDKPYSLELLSFYKDGKHLQAYKKNREIYPIDMAVIKQKVPVSDELGEILSHFHDYSVQQFHITPSPDGVHFKGKIFLLVNQGVYSSAETLAIFAKNTRFATLIGEQTGGDGIGTDPMIVVLPHTRFAMRFSKQLGIDPQGNINEFAPTVPDHIVSVPKTLPSSLDELLADPSVLKVLELAGLSG